MEDNARVFVGIDLAKLRNAVAVADGQRWQHRDKNGPGTCFKWGQLGLIKSSMVEAGQHR